MTLPPLPTGRHLVADLVGGRGLDDPAVVETSLREAAKAARVTLLDIRLHHFGPENGVTGVALLAESHISIHTWPEHALTAIDIFVCGANADPESALAVIAHRLGAEVRERSEIARLGAA